MRAILITTYFDGLEIWSLKSRKTTKNENDEDFGFRNKENVISLHKLFDLLIKII